MTDHAAGAPPKPEGLDSMIVLRLKQTFPLRIAEWLMAAVILSWGLVLIQPDDVFGRNPALARLGEYFPQIVWAYACLIIGITRLLALGINGAWRNSPHLRAACAFVSCFLWLQISLGVIQVGITNTGVAVYPWFMLLDIYCVFRAAVDARISDDKARGRAAL